MENKMVKLKSNLIVYIIIWFVFVMIFTINLKNVSTITIPMLFVYMIYYIVILSNESRKISKYMKEKHNNVWKTINTPLSSNIFKWYTIIGKNSQNEDLKMVKKHLNGLVLLHVLHFITFLIVPQLLKLLS